MHLRIIILSIFSQLISLATYGQQPGMELTEVLLKSFKTENFKLLDPYLLDEAIARKMAPSELGKRSSGEIKKLLTDSKARLQEGWKMIAGNVKEHQIDLSALKIAEVILYHPIPGKDMTGLIAAYEYKGKKYEDFQLIVGVVEGKTYLLEFPMTTRMLTLHENGRSELEEAKQAIRLADPEMNSQLQERVKQLIIAVQSENTSGFGKLCLYRGDDEVKKWKEAANTDSESDMVWPIETMGKLKKQLTSCEGQIFSKFFSETESEGTWIVQPLQCTGGKTINFAFLEINGELLLGDVDIEMKGE